MRAVPLLTAALFLLGSAQSAFAGWEEGQAAYGRKDWVGAAKEFQPLAQAGHVGAMSRLGHMTLLGQGVPKNEAEAFRLLLGAAEKGDAAAQNGVGSLFFKGIGTPRDVSQALIWFGRAADQGLPKAQNNLGQLYMMGNGVAKDEAKGVELLRKAAEKGVPASWETLGLAFWDGKGVPADRAEAVRWYRKAAEAGMLLSQNRLGSALWNGDGVAKNPAEAVRWFEAAANQGDGSSLYNVALAYLHGIGAAKDNEKAALYAILAVRYAKPADRARFEEARDQARQRIGEDIWVRAEEQAARWKPKTGVNDPDAAKGDLAPPPPARPQITAGSGIVIGRDGLVLTNSHVVDRCRNIRVSLEGMAPQAATVVARDAANDLAALKASFRPSAIGRFREDKPLRSGDAVVVIGYPLSNLLSREPNVTAGVVSALAGLKGDKRSYQITAPVQKGNSGGPLADMSGNVVGIVSAKLNAMKIADRLGDLPQNVNFAIKAELARNFLSANGLSFETAPAAQSLSPADVGEIVKKVTVFVECEG